MQITLFQGDCLELMEPMEDGLFDMILTDPPYSSGGLYAGDRQKSTASKYTDTTYNGASRFPDFSGDNMDQRSFTEFMRMVLAKARIKSKDGAVIAVFVDWRNLAAMTDALQAAGWVYRGIVVWNKGNARNIPGRFRQDCEFVVWGTNGQKPVDWTPGSTALQGFYSEKSVPSKKKHHQTEKPVSLLEKLIGISPADGYVCDLFMGSGSTGVACINTDRNFTGIELSRPIFDTAKTRIGEAMAEIKENVTEPDGAT